VRFPRLSPRIRSLRGPIRRKSQVFSLPKREIGRRAVRGRPRTQPASPGVFRKPWRSSGIRFHCRILVPLRASPFAAFERSSPKNSDPRALSFRCDESYTDQLAMLAFPNAIAWSVSRRYTAPTARKAAVASLRHLVMTLQRRLGERPDPNTTGSPAVRRALWC